MRIVIVAFVVVVVVVNASIIHETKLKLLLYVIFGRGWSGCPEQRLSALARWRVGALSAH